MTSKEIRLAAIAAVLEQTLHDAHPDPDAEEGDRRSFQTSVACVLFTAGFEGTAEECFNVIQAAKQFHPMCFKNDRWDHEHGRCVCPTGD